MKTTTKLADIVSSRNFIWYCFLSFYPFLNLQMINEVHIGTKWNQNIPSSISRQISIKRRQTLAEKAWKPQYPQPPSIRRLLRIPRVTHVVLKRTVWQTRNYATVTFPEDHYWSLRTPAPPRAASPENCLCMSLFCIYCANEWLQMSRPGGAAACRISGYCMTWEETFDRVEGSVASPANGCPFEGGELKDFYGDGISGMFWLTCTIQLGPLV